MKEKENTNIFALANLDYRENQETFLTKFYLPL